MYKKMVLIFLLCPLLLFAQTIEAPENIDVVIKRAYENSNTVKRLEINENNYELQKSLRDNLDSDENFIYNVEVSSLTAKKDIDGDFVLSTTPQLSPQFTVTFPEIGDEYYLSTGFSSSFELDGGTFTKSVSPFANITKTFTFGYEDVTETIEYDQSDLKNYITSKEAYYNFEIGLINSLIEIMQQKKAIEEAQASLDESKEDLDNQILLKEITEGSVDYLNFQLSHSSQEININGLKTKLETSIANFVNAYGIEPVDVMVTSRPEPGIEINENGNSLVKEKKLALDLAKEEIKKMTGLTETLSLKADAGATLLATTQDATLGLSGTYSSDTFSVSASSELFYKNKNLYPSLTVSGNYSNGKINTQVDDIQLSQARNAELLAQMNYDQALIDYKAEVNELKTEIEDWKIQLLQLENQLSYHKKVLEQNQKLYEKGFATIKEVEKSQDNIKNDLFDQQILFIKGKVLLLQVAVLEL